jgi:hypothetical protein
MIDAKSGGVPRLEMGLTYSAMGSLAGSYNTDSPVVEILSINGDAMESFSGQSVGKNELVLFYERGR